MRNTIVALGSVFFFLGTACSSSQGDTSAVTTGAATTSAGAGATTAGSGTTTTGGGGGNGSTTTGGSILLAAGAPCSSNATCQSDVCGLNGSGNCCTTACKTDDARCAATACDSSGACTYPAAGGACNGTCQFGLFTAYTCDGAGACSPSKPVACPNNLACNNDGTACQGSCSTANGAADCSLGWYCTASGTCAPQIQLGPCTLNAECQSNVCGISGSGHCCTQTACTNTAVPCGTTDCDNVTGACTFPPTSTSCDTGPLSCSDDHTQSNPNTFCDGLGTCLPPVLTDCTPFACLPPDGGGDGCALSCTSIADCAKDFYCNSGACIPQKTIGPCSENDACLSSQCGANGTGNCCYNPCGSTDPSCGITSCDPVSGACQYPGTSQACGTIHESCSGITQQNPGLCDGAGNCPNPGTTNCTPFRCGATSCKTNCTDDSACAAGDRCSVRAAVCCPALLSGASLNVDTQLGSDSTGCCGLAGYPPCQTIGFAMQLIDSALASNVTINASVGGPGGTGDWTYGSSGELIPIVLGWGVELKAPGISFGPNFYDLNENNSTGQPFPEIFDIAQYSPNDTMGYASIVGSFTAGQVQIGLSEIGDGTEEINDTSAVQVEDGQHLYIANAMLNGSINFGTAALTIAPGGSVTFGQDQSAAVKGTVDIGSPQNSSQFFGYRGIVCQSDYVSKGCTIDDAALTAATGTKSVVIQGQSYQDIDAEDFASISLTSAPMVGFAPSAAGYRTCPTKQDVSYSGGAAIQLNGPSTMTFNSGFVQCISGTGFQLQASSQGNPTLNLTGTTIQNTDQAIYASAGIATIAKSTIWYNYNGVQQDTDGTNTATIDLSGGAVGGTNTVACASSTEYSNYFTGGTFNPSVNVLNSTTAALNASNVAWDTAGPDLFSCTDSSLLTCTCQLAACTNPGGVDDMDAVYDSSGTVTTTGAKVSPADCTPPTICGEQICGSGETCCEQFEECLPAGEKCGGGPCGPCGPCGICGPCGPCGIFPCGILPCGRG